MRFFSIALVVALPLFAGAWPGTVVGVHDGDSITVLQANKTLVFGKTVEITERGKDRYGRTLADVQAGSIAVTKTMVATGMAWHFAKYSKDASLQEAQSQAQVARLGSGRTSPVPPWEWRKK